MEKRLELGFRNWNRHSYVRRNLWWFHNAVKETQNRIPLSPLYWPFYGLPETLLQIAISTKVT